MFVLFPSKLMLVYNVVQIFGNLWLLQNYVRLAWFNDYNWSECSHL